MIFKKHFTLSKFTPAFPSFIFQNIAMMILYKLTALKKMKVDYHKDRLNHCVSLPPSYIENGLSNLGKEMPNVSCVKVTPSNLASDITNKINISCYTE